MLSIEVMGTLTIRKLDDRLKTRLRVRAAHHGRSMEEEARQILKSALVTADTSPPGNIGEEIRKLFAPLGGFEVPDMRAHPILVQPDFAKHAKASAPPRTPRRKNKDRAR
jgi:antitoxin FitA